MGPAESTAPLRVLVAGGDIAALEAMLTLRRLTSDHVAIALVTPQRDFVYRPLAIAEPFGLGRAHRFDLATLAASAGAELVPSRVIGVDAGRHQVVTDGGETLSYDALLIASGARPRLALPGAITFWGIADGAEIAGLLAELEQGIAQRVAFAAHRGVGWPLPIYELALLSDAHLRRAGIAGRPLVVVTYEAEPLEMLGPEASRSVGELLASRDIDFVGSRHPTGVREGALHATSSDPLPVDRVVTLPHHEGPRLAGIPADERGFVPVDALGRVPGAADVYAAGDVTTLPISRSALVSDHANAVATAIAATVGAPVDPQPFRPVLRGRLRAGRRPNGRPAVDDGSKVGAETLWWPPGRIGGRRLVAHLAEIAGQDVAPSEPPGDGSSTAVELELSVAA